MKLQNGYTVMYEAKDKVTLEAPGPLYAAPVIPRVEDAMLISYNNGATYVDCKQFKLIYSDGTHLFGSVETIPTEEDINIVLKAGDVVVFGEVIA